MSREIVRPVEAIEALRALGDSPAPRLVLWPEDGPDGVAGAGRVASRAPLPGSVALLAGSFDPPTVGHEELATAAARHAELVVLVYSARSLPKEAGAEAPLLGTAERLRALEAMCDARAWLAVGLASHGLLADQARAAADRFPGARLAVVVGSDKLIQLLDPAWYDDRDAALSALFGAADVLVAARAGEESALSEAVAEAGRLGWGNRIARLDADPRAAGVSSRLVRRRARAGADVGDLVPPEALPAVLEAIRRERAG